jgi:hypothetical protein
MGGIVAALLLVLLPMSVLANGWTIVASPNVVGALATNQLNATTCASSTECWAVGQYLAGTGIDQTLIQESRGGAWATVPSPDVNDGGTQSNLLDSVTCASSTECWAVGAYGTSPDQQTLVEEWNGGSWVVVDSPSTSPTQNNVLYGVTCASASLCLAVGWYRNGGGVIQTLVEQWDGTSWAIVASPNTASTADNELNDVTCFASTECWAVGGGPQQPLIEEWTGTAWTIVASPVVSTGANNLLYGVTCVTATDCWAVGIYTGGSNGHDTLAEQWNGATWSVVSTPNASTTLSNLLLSVTCTSASECWAVGWYNTNTGSSTLVEEWTGGAWAIVSAPDPADSNDLYSVACWSSTGCWGVGQSSSDGTLATQTLIETWGGSVWATASSPNSTGAIVASDVLSGIACASATQCWAVGGSDITGGVGGSIIDGWNGNTWQPAPAPANPGGEFSGVACASSTECWAVGSAPAGGTGATQTLIEEWEAGTWSIVTSPNASPSQANFLDGVTCVSATQCWAVGNFSTGGVSQTLIEELVSGTWTIVASPDTDPSQNNNLTSVACSAAGECWAVGSTNTGFVGYQTLVEEWTGSSWSIVSSPNNGTQDNVLNSVACASSTNCWAVGQYESGAGMPQQSLIEQWDGVSWSIVTSPNVNRPYGSGLQDNDLSGVTCSSASDCWAVGWDSSFAAGQDEDQTVIDSWSGASWAVVSSPNSQTLANSDLGSVACVSASECWAAGTSGPYGSHQTLVEEWLGSGLPTITSVAPAAGPVTGGQVVSVAGTGFVAGMSVNIGGASVTPTHVTPTSFQFTTPAGVPGLAYVTVSVAIGSSPTGPGSGYVYTPLASYFPLTPFRILDTRSDTCFQCSGGALGAGATRTIQITGLLGLSGGADVIPPTATAVVLNLTAVNDASSSLLTIYPTGTARPLASNLNFTPHTASANLVTVALGQTSPSDAYREINIFNAVGTVAVVADVQGYFAPQSAAAPVGEFHPIAPIRECDTRAHVTANPCNGNGSNSVDSTLGTGGIREVNVGAVAGAGGSIPTDGSAEAAVLNLTAVAGTVATYLSVFPPDAQGHCTIPGGGSAPRFSTLNVGPAVALANRVIVPLGPASIGGNDTDICVYNSEGTINIVVDANGWFGSPSASAGKQFQATGPSRVCDTRAGSGTPCAGRMLVPGGIDTIAVAGVAGVPVTGAVAVIANLTAVDGSAGTVFTLYPANLARPLASDLNVGPSVALPNLAVVELDTTTDSTAGDVKLYNGLGNINAILDVEGWFQ